MADSGLAPMIGIVEVAAQAGVSPATVSRALRGLPGVSAATRAKVEDAADALGYVGSPIAAALARGRTNTIGVLAPWVSRWFFSAVTEAVREVVAEHGYDVLLYPVRVSAETDTTIGAFSLSKRVDGVLRVNVPPGVRPVSDHDLRMPLVTIGFPLEGVAGVQLDDAYVGYLATRHLLDLGHRRIAFAGLDPDSIYGFRTAADRHEGFCWAMREAGLSVDPALVKTTGFAVEGGEAAIHALLTDVGSDVAALPTAIFAVSDEVAMGVIHAARRRGIVVPGELSIIGVDDHDYSYLFDLTTIAQPVREQGRIAAAMLLDQIASAVRPEPVLVPARAELVLRNTTAPPRSW